MKFSCSSMCNANARYITSLTNEALLNKDTFHCSKRTVKNYSLFSLVIEQVQEWKSSVKTRKFASQFSPVSHSEDPLQSALSFPPLEIPCFILSFHPSIHPRVPSHGSVDFFMDLLKSWNRPLPSILSWLYSYGNKL